MGFAEDRSQNLVSDRDCDAAPRSGSLSVGARAGHMIRAVLMPLPL
jgi:hypothetical protein